ncbi:hypothetical protein K432DRAFT_399827 [Lepidopterella palustris CBS 459.81]|uniref:Uncharacterized protein n=1 Tax=Lepidopterella palustris CBS 459.81 TaxID=1314670 RepID=A0A8E2ELG4_9PEZI|nr:hypothetical protein K432DRAFT_399827 [Lepidopterella palustris CBS 459.81]
MQGSSSVFAVLQLPATLNPFKFGSLSALTSLGAPKSAAVGLSPADLFIVKALPASLDPSYLITTIMAITENILILADTASTLKAATFIILLHFMGLAIPNVMLP